MRRFESCRGYQTPATYEPETVADHCPAWTSGWRTAIIQDTQELGREQGTVDGSARIEQQASAAPVRPTRVIHSSDLHLGIDEAKHSVHLLEAVLGAARATAADVILLVGDVFDHNRVRPELLDATTKLLAAAGRPTVILPGNHDSLADGSVYRRGDFASVEGVHVIGLTSDETVHFPELDLEVWGRAHFDLFDMVPLRDPPKRRTRWHIAAAHGHWVTGPHDARRAYLIHDHEIRSIDADYLALGHWDKWAPAGDGTVPAYYSGSPAFAKSVNLIELDPASGVRVDRVPVIEG
ncbi:MAG: metallophosphoesterase [Dehalococcoidia bacterium]